MSNMLCCHPDPSGIVWSDRSRRQAHGICPSLSSIYHPALLRTDSKRLSSFHPDRLDGVHRLAPTSRHVLSALPCGLPRSSIDCPARDVFIPRPPFRDLKLANARTWRVPRSCDASGRGVLEFNGTYGRLSWYLFTRARNRRAVSCTPR